MKWVRRKTLEKKIFEANELFNNILEYNVLQPSPLNEKVLKEKRKKLKETFDRVMRLLHEEGEIEQWSEYKRKEVDYEKRKHKRVQYYESVRNAEQVNIEDIPLPSSTNEKPLPATMPKINLPPPVLLTNVPIPSALKKTDEYGDRFENKEKEPPGVPSSLPPNLCDMRELDSDYESDDKDFESEEDVPLRIEPAKDKHDKNIEEFMKEVESAQKKKEEEKAMETIRIDPTPAVEMEESIDKPHEKDPPRSLSENIGKPQDISMPQSMPMVMPRIPHPLMFRPPPMRASMPMGLRMPPAPPPNRPIITNVGMNRMGIRIAPGPPLGLPPRHKQHHHHQHHERNAPQKDPKSATITAKPQIRNLSADVMRFVPATLRVKRDEPKRPKPKSYIIETKRQPLPAQGQQQKPKDDAYQQFMSELQDLL